MSAVVAGVKAKLALKLPGQIGTNRQWSDTYIETLCLAAAHAAAERIGYQWVTQTINLVNDQHEYALGSTFVDVKTVLYSRDGTTFDDWISPVSMQKLDRSWHRWRQDRGTPGYYVLLSAPGLQDVSTQGISAKIMIYPADSSVGSSKIKVSGVGIATATSNVPDGVQERVHVPYVMAILRAVQDPGEAKMWYEKYLYEADKMRGRFITPYPGGTTDMIMNLNGEGWL